MLKTIVALLLVLHGMVHLLYSCQSRRPFELKVGMVWPDGSWALSRVLGPAATMTSASVLMVAADVGFAVGGAALLLSEGRWQYWIGDAGLLSTISYLLLWDGTRANLDGRAWLASRWSWPFSGCSWWRAWAASTTRVYQNSPGVKVVERRPQSTSGDLI